MHTGIYKNDGNFLESLISNIKKDGTIVQSLIGGLGTGGGVLANGLSGIRIFNNNKSISNFNNVLNSADLNNKKIEYNELLDSNLKLKKYLEKINKNTDIDYTVPEDLREDFLKLSILNKEITTGRTIDSDEINILKQNITGTILTPKDIDANKKEITKIFAQNERLRKFEQMILNGDTLVDVPDDLVDDINKIYALIEENKIGVRYNHNVNNRIPKYFTDITQTRALNNDEINARLKIIHQNPELLALIENPDENIIIPEHLQDDYNYLKKLINEINLKETVENPFSRVVLNPNDNYLDYTLDIATAPNDFYQRNLDYFLKKGITYDDYIKATGINIKKYDTSNIISEAVDFNDRSLYLTQKIKEIMNMPGIPDTTKNKLQSFYNTRTKDINLDDLETILKDYIPESELQILHSIKGQELRDVLSLEEQTAIYQYTRAGGGDVCDALRKDNFERLKEIEELMNKYAREHSYNTRTFDNILPDELIGVLSKNTNRETISATRYVNSLSVLISPSSDLNTFNLDELIGKSYTDKALTSFTLVDGIDTTYSKNKIKMHASIDLGCGSLIQNVSGIYSETSEFLTLPGTKTTIIDAYRNIDGSIVLETIVSLID